jgi:hypothetical protein
MPKYPTVHPLVMDRNGCEVMATPKDNLAVEKWILDEHQDPTTIEKVHYLLATTLDQ